MMMDLERLPHQHLDHLWSSITVFQASPGYVPAHPTPVPCWHLRGTRLASLYLQLSLQMLELEAIHFPTHSDTALYQGQPSEAGY